MHVVVDATPLHGAEGRRGSGRFVRGLLSGLAAQPDLRVTALRPAKMSVDADEQVTIRRWAPGRWAPVERRIAGTRELRRGGPRDVTHVLRVHPPATVPRPYVQTLLDVIPLVSDDAALAAERRRWVRSAPIYRSADRVVAISKHAADQGLRHLGLGPRQIEVVLPGVAAEFSVTGDRYEHRAPYVLLVAEHSRRKGFGDAFAVIAQIAERGLPHRLVVAGRIEPWVHGELHAEVQRSPRPDLVDLLGFAHDIAAVYRGADLVIVPSRHEGFGLPAIEAMACGAPVVSYDNTSLPEAVGDAGRLVPDGRPDLMADAAAEILLTPSLRDELAGRGLARAADLTWARCAQGHVDIYRSAANG